MFLLYIFYIHISLQNRCELKRKTLPDWNSTPKKNENDCETERPLNLIKGQEFESKAEEDYGEWRQCQQNTILEAKLPLGNDVKGRKLIKKVAMIQPNLSLYVIKQLQLTGPQLYFEQEEKCNILLEFAMWI